MAAQKTLQLFSVFLFVAFSIALSTADTSSVITISNVNFPSSFEDDSDSFTFTFDVEYSGASESADIDFSASTATLGSVFIPTQQGMNGTIDETRTVTGLVSGLQGTGPSSTTITISAEFSGSVDNETTFTTQITDADASTGDDVVCPVGQVGDLEITNFDIDNEGEGDDEEWQPLDKLVIEVEVEADVIDGDEVEDVMVEIFIFDGDGNDVTNDFDFEDEEESLGDIDDDDEETATFEILELPADIDEGNYDIYVKAYSDGADEEHCTSESNDMNEEFYHTIDYERIDDNAIIVTVDDLASNKVIASCGNENIALSFPVYNVGKDKEDEVLVNLYNAELDIDEYSHIGSLSEGNKKTVDFLFDIPENAAEKLYKLEVISYYDFDDDGDELDHFSYDQNSMDDLDEDYEIQLELIGCTPANPTVTAALASEANVEENLIIEATITGNAENTDYLVSLAGVSSWAEVVSVTPSSFSLDKGDSKTVTITLLPSQGGTYTFTLNTIYDGETYSRPITVSITGSEEPNTGVFTGLSIFGVDGETSLFTRILLIGILILVGLIVITLIIRLARGSRRTETF